jgi:hypothetical protein
VRTVLGTVVLSSAMHSYLEIEESMDRIPMCEACSEALQKTPEGDREDENSQIEMLHERTLDNLWGFDDDDKINRDNSSLEIVSFYCVLHIR